MPANAECIYISVSLTLGKEPQPRPILHLSTRCRLFLWALLALQLLYSLRDYEDGPLNKFPGMPKLCRL
jgi:hypothetical protein